MSAAGRFAALAAGDVSFQQEFEPLGSPAAAPGGGRGGGSDDKRGGGPGFSEGDNAKMEQRLSEVEKAVARVDAVLPNLATKAELAELKAVMHEGFGSMVKWIVGTGFVGFAAFVTIITFVLNNAVPKVVAPQLAQQPTIIFVPAGTPVPSAAASMPATRP